jgi:hypothetical protein
MDHKEEPLTILGRRYSITGTTVPGSIIFELVFRNEEPVRVVPGAFVELADIR